MIRPTPIPRVRFGYRNRKDYKIFFYKFLYQWILVPSNNLSWFLTRTLIVSPWQTLMRGPGSCLFTVIMGRCRPLPDTQSRLSQLVKLNGQFKHALLNVEYHSTFQSYSHIMGFVFSLQGLSHASVCNASIKMRNNSVRTYI